MGSIIDKGRAEEWLKESILSAADLRVGSASYTDISGRKMFVSAPASHYGEVDTMYVVFEGSPSRLPTLITGLTLNMIAEVSINGKLLRSRSALKLADNVIEAAYNYKEAFNL